ncbi:MAG: hypothetical protein V1750_06070, partial [Acidobacteriota bacterium]
DNAGRTAQLTSARAAGARTVYISRRPARRRKAFRLRWLRLLAAHWIAFPPFIDGPLGPLEKLKLRLFPGVEVVFLGAVLADSEPARRAELKASLSLGAEPYVLFAPGGGGKHGAGGDAPRIFAAAAARVAAATGVQAVAVMGPSFSGAAAGSPGVRTLPSLPHEQLMDLLHDAHVAVINGGTTLTQALAQQRVCVTVPIASDQHLRVQRCARAGVVVPAGLDADELAATVTALLADSQRHQAIAARVAALGMENGVPKALASLERLLAARPGGGGGE